jgi:aryl-alcohol dehydrogenase-like predicted oxidoreductase
VPVAFQGDHFGPKTAKKWDFYTNAGIEELRGEMSQAEFILRFTISHPDLSTAIIGTLDPSHVAENVASVARGPLPGDLYEEAKSRLTAAGSVVRAW